MAYQFQNQTVAKFNLGGDLDQNTISLNGVNGSLSSADTVVNGVKGLLWICGEEDGYTYTSGVRTVKQNVINQ